ncbi:MFS transporter [Falsihalocynthiibacter sp. SS001]|uniref:MFS transporter n=1 Tax=Falsihalocynthiibacter sp. SS001 TaxID=3349698 RepID=UPI0036D285A8
MISQRLSTHAMYRWVVLAAAGLTLGVAMGFLVNGFSAFVVPLEMYFGWPRAHISAINSIGLVGIAVGGIAMGFAADRIATRTICLIGAISLSFALLLASMSDELWQFYALFFIAGAIGGGGLFAPVIALVGGWFQKGAGLAIGIASAGQAVGQGLVPFATGYLIELTGWQDALATLGICAACILIPLSLVMIEPPKLATGTAAPQHAPQLISPKIILPAMSVAVLGCCTGMAVPLMHLVPLIQGVCGVGAAAGGPLLLMLVFAVGGRIFFGGLADKIGPLRSWMAATTWQTVLVSGFILLGTMQAFWLFAPLYGFGYGGVMTGVLVSVRALTPPERRASATGIVLAFGWLGHALGGWQGGFFFDLTGAYDWTYINAALAGTINLFIVGTIFIVLRKRQLATA